MRQQHTQYITDKSMNEEVVNPIRHRLRAILRGIYLDIFSFIFFIYIRYKMNSVYYHFHFHFNFHYYKKASICFVIFIPLLVLSVISFIKSCIIFTKFNKAKVIDPKNNYNYLKILNLIFIILTSLLYLLYLVYPIINLIYGKLPYSYSNNESNNTSVSDKKNNTENDTSKQDQTKEKFENNNNAIDINNINNVTNNIK